MRSDKRCYKLAEKIRELLQAGIYLSPGVIHFIDSTFSNPSAKEFENIIIDDNNIEKDPLTDLIFFPDETDQIQLEDILESENFQKEDAGKILNYLLSYKLETVVYFPDNRGSLKISMPRWVTGQFLTRLNICKKQDKRIIDAVDRCFFINAAPNKGRGSDIYLKKLIKVKLRNTKTEFSENKILFLCSFFKKMKVNRNDFLGCLDFILSFFEEQKNEINIFNTLKEKKSHLLQSLEDLKTSKKKLKKSNMETLMLKNERFLYINKSVLINKIKSIDKISNYVFGQTIS